MPKHDPFEELLDAQASEIGSNIAVRNSFPRITNVPYRLAIIGEAPGVDETSQGIPFVGFSGQQLDRFLSRFGILRDACFLGNICQHRPPKNVLAELEWSGPEIQQGIMQLTRDLDKFRPNCILLLGGAALHAFKDPTHAPRRKKTLKGMTFVFTNSLGDWRGSFFKSSMAAPLPDVKCIASYHPGACLRQYEWTPMLMMDIKRAFDDSTTEELILPERQLLIESDIEIVLQRLAEIKARKPLISIDIEGYVDAMTCISVAPTDSYAFIVPMSKLNGDHIYSLDDECRMWGALIDVLTDHEIPKVLQNSLYDRFVLQYSYGIVVRGVHDDTMLKHWELYCELEKALSVQASLYTREPFYKFERKINDSATHWRYCCRDSAVTYEINSKLDRWVTGESKRHYDFNIVLLNALLYMELRGIKYNAAEARERLKLVNEQIYELQVDLDKVAGFGLTTTDKLVLRALVRDLMCHKRDQSKVKAPYVDDFNQCMRVLQSESPLTKAEMGMLSIALGVSLNIKGPELKKYLYDTLDLPVQHDPITKAVTANYAALITLRKHSNHPSIPLAIDIGELRTRAQMLTLRTDADGRIRSSYNEVGSETGRITSSTSPTGSGYNLQTIPDENELKLDVSPLRYGMRDLLTADDGCYLAKCDLRGADGWTVGANLASLGDSTMLDDLRFGLKPASILCFARRHGVASISGKSREELAILCREVKKSDWDYFAYKQCIWGFCYLMGVRKASQHVFTVSEGSVSVSGEDMQQAKDMLLRRYRIDLWWKAMEKKLYSQPYPPKLLSPSGHTRKFFGRKADILGEALAHEPQSVTTYATNSAVYKCWMDPENRTPSGGLRIEPIHQVHDEFLSQFKIKDTDWALGKIRSWFETPITIAGIQVTIPADGAYGTNWAMDKLSKKGTI